jgi:hypothetical protein
MVWRFKARVGEVAIGIFYKPCVSSANSFFPLYHSSLEHNRTREKHRSCSAAKPAPIPA